jgi:hypothetical protein
MQHDSAVIYIICVTLFKFIGKLPTTNQFFPMFSIDNEEKIDSQKSIYLKTRTIFRLHYDKTINTPTHPWTRRTNMPTMLKQQYPITARGTNLRTTYHSGMPMQKLQLLLPCIDNSYEKIEKF